MFSDVLHLQALNGSAWWKLPLGLGTAMQCCAAGAGSGAKYFQKLEIVTRRNDDRLIGYDYFFWHIYIYINVNHWILGYPIFWQILWKKVTKTRRDGGLEGWRTSEGALVTRTLLAWFGMERIMHSHTCLDLEFFCFPLSQTSHISECNAAPYQKDSPHRSLWLSTMATTAASHSKPFAPSGMARILPAPWHRALGIC